MNNLLFKLLYPIEKVLRFWFPYAFRDDPIDPEPQSKEARRKKRIKQRQQRKEMKEQKGTAMEQRRHHKSERQKVKDDPDYKPKTLQDKDVQKTNKPYIQDDNDKESEADIFAGLERLKQHKPIGKKKKLGIEMIDMSAEMDNDQALDMLSQSDAGVGFYWHDLNSHQVAIKFEKNSIKNEHKLRDNVARRQLKPLLYPKQEDHFDRTHVIPIGYHGSENDKRLLVGFNSKINQVYLKNFEDKVSVMNKDHAILWFVDIKRQKDKSAKWNTIVWNEKGEKLIERTFHDKHEFVWLDS